MRKVSHAYENSGEMVLARRTSITSLPNKYYIAATKVLTF